MLAHILWIKYFVLNSWVLLICKHLHFLKLLKQTRINNGAFREKNINYETNVFNCSVVIDSGTT